MISLWKLTLFFLLCLTIALGLNLPLSQLLVWVKLPPEIQIQGPDGNLMKGEVDRLTLKNYPINDVSYDFQPSCLSKLQICYQVRFDQGEMDVGYSLINNQTVISDANIEFPASDIKLINPQLLVGPLGTLHLQLSRLAFIDNKPGDLEGVLVWRDLGIEEATSNMGDFQIDFNGNQEGYTFTTKHLEAILIVDGGGQLAPDGVYSVDIGIETDSRIDPSVKYILDIAARKLAPDKYRINQKGRLPAATVRQLF